LAIAFWIGLYTVKYLDRYDIPGAAQTGRNFWIDRTNNLFAIFMVQTQNYKAPTYNAFRSLVNEASGINSNPYPARSMFGNALRQRDANGDGKLGREELPQALFDRLDQDKDGFVSESELKSLRRGNRSE
jgi:hypothetical protein